MRLGRITALSPLRVRVNGDLLDAPARAAGVFSGAAVATEVLVETVDQQRYAWQVWGSVAPTPVEPSSTAAAQLPAPLPFPPGT